MKEYWDYAIDSIVNLLVALFMDLWEMLTDLVFMIAEQVLGVMAWAIAKVKKELPDMDSSGYWAKAPDDLIQLLTYVDFHVCIGMVTAAIGIRFVLNFIPFIK